MMLFALVRKECLALMRDPHALAALFLMPAVFIVVMSLALENLYTPPPDRFAYAVVDRDGSAMAKRLTADWAQRHGAPRALPESVDEALRRGRLAYVIDLAPGMAQALASPAPADTPVVRLRVEPGMDGGSFRSLQAEVAWKVGELRARALLARVPGFMGGRNPSVLPFIAAEQSDTGAMRPTAVQQNVPAWLVFGMFFVVTAVAGLFVAEQQGGTLARLAAMGVPDRVQVLAKALPYVGVNCLQAVLMLAVGRFLIPALGGQALALQGVDWLALAAVLLALSLAAIGFALLLACLARTHAQANTVGPMCNILMAAFGGIMVPTFVMPPAMQQLATFSPMNWGLEGLLDVLLRHGGLAEAAPWALRLALFGFLALAAASHLFSCRIRP